MSMKKYFGEVMASASDIAQCDKDGLIGKRDALSVKIGFLQHERLVHLIVTALIAVLLFISIAAYVLDGGLVLLPVIILLICLEVPYIAHYYFLENTCQELYTVYDAICRKIAEATENEG